MKRRLLLFAICLLVYNGLFANKLFILVEDYKFTPSTATVPLGDTIVFMWMGGSHTTTSTDVPLGAASWDATLNSGSPVFMYVPTVAGSYIYKCTPHLAMGMTGGFTVTSTTGVRQYSNSPIVNLTPNPASSSVNVQFGSPLRQINIAVADLTGRVVFTGYYYNMEMVAFDVSGLNNGLYILYGQNEKGKFATKLMVAH